MHTMDEKVVMCACSMLVFVKSSSFCSLTVSAMFGEILHTHMDTLPNKDNLSCIKATSIAL